MGQKTIRPKSSFGKKFSKFKKAITGEGKGNALADYLMSDKHSNKRPKGAKHLKVKK